MNCNGNNTNIGVTFHQKVAVFVSSYWTYSCKQIVNNKIRIVYIYVGERYKNER